MIDINEHCRVCYGGDWLAFWHDLQGLLRIVATRSDNYTRKRRARIIEDLVAVRVELDRETREDK